MSIFVLINKCCFFNKSLKCSLRFLIKSDKWSSRKWNNKAIARADFGRMNRRSQLNHDIERAAFNCSLTLENCIVFCTKVNEQSAFSVTYIVVEELQCKHSWNTHTLTECFVVGSILVKNRKGTLEAVYFWSNFQFEFDSKVI